MLHNNKIDCFFKKIALLLVSISFFSIKSLPIEVRNNCKAFARDHLLSENFSHNGIVDTFFFTPDQSKDLKYTLIGLIDSEKKMIKAALFRLTDSDIAEAIIDAYKRGVLVELVVDADALNIAQYSKVSALESYDIPIFVYQPIDLFRKKLNKKTKVKKYQSIMHHKTFILCNTIGGSVVVSGSLNPTYAAFHGNEEMVIIRNNVVFFEKWNNHFEKLKKRCIKKN